ncbi:hypothetical protein Angca_001856, partial [Angiostrongylus cantonensis]
MGSMPKCLDIGNKPRKLRNEICEDVSEFLIILAHTVLYQFGGYPREEFREYSFGSGVQAQLCCNDQVLKYCQRSAHLANQAMQKDNLENYEVSIEDGSGEALIAFRVAFRRSPEFSNRTIRSLAEPELCTLRSNLGNVIHGLQTIVISNELREKLNSTPTRLRIRLQLCNTQSKRLFKTTNESVLPPVLKPWSDIVRNELNQVI